MSRFCRAFRLKSLQINLNFPIRKIKYKENTLCFPEQISFVLRLSLHNGGFEEGGNRKLSNACLELMTFGKFKNSKHSSRCQNNDDLKVRVSSTLLRKCYGGCYCEAKWLLWRLHTLDKCQLPEVPRSSTWPLYARRLGSKHSCNNRLPEKHCGIICICLLHWLSSW